MFAGGNKNFIQKKQQNLLLCTLISFWNILIFQIRVCYLFLNNQSFLVFVEKSELTSFVNQLVIISLQKMKNYEKCFFLLKKCIVWLVKISLFLNDKALNNYINIKHIHKIFFVIVKKKYFEIEEIVYWVSKYYSIYSCLTNIIEINLIYRVIAYFR